jgi:hypothetical protein
MASYEQNYDPGSYQVSPYQLPIQQIMQAVQTRNQYWDSGATALKSAYQNYLGLQLSNPDNQNQLNTLMQGVNDNLKQTSKTDLSIGENYGNALKIFDPITQNQNIMGDNAITKQAQKELATGENFRLQNGGKEYNPASIQDIRNHLNDFAQDNPNNWRQHYANQVSYTPYTDVAAEVRQVAKDFKPDIKSMTTPMYIDPVTGQPSTKGGTQSGYMLNETDKSVIASQYRAFMSAHLSDKAQNQLAIEGRVKYHNNIGALAQDYSSYNQDKINTYKTQIQTLQGSIAGTNGTPAEKDAATTQINNYQAQIKELNLQNTKMAGGDYSNITPYKDQIAGSLYSNNYIDYLSKASAQRNIDIKYTPDQVWKTMFQESNENSRFNIARETQLAIARERNETQLKIHGMIGLNGKELTGVPTYGISDDTHNEQFGVDEFNKLQTASQADFQKAVDGLNTKIKVDTGIDPNDTKMPAAQRDAATQKYLTNHQNDYDVKQYYAAAQKKTIDDATFQSINDWVNGKIKTENPDIFNAKQSVLAGITQPKTIYLSALDGSGNGQSVTMSAQEQKDMYNGSSAKYQLGTSQQMQGNGRVGVDKNVSVITYNGKQYRFSDSSMDDVVNKLSQGDQSLTDKRSDLLNQQINRISGIEQIFQNDKNPYYNAAHQLVMRTVAGSKSDLKPEDVLLTDKDNNGGVYFKVQNDQNANVKDIKNKVEAAGGRYVQAEDKYYLPGTKFGYITQQQQFTDPRLSSVQKLVDFRSSATPNDRFNTPPMTFGNRNFNFKVDMQDGHPVYRIVDPVSGASFGSTTEGVPYTTLQDAAARAQFLGELKPDQYINLVRTVGNVPDYQPQ